jgi:thiamine biosynthesis lipoprotein
MPLVETLPVRADTAQWTVWSTVARVVVEDPAALSAARRIVAEVVAEVDQACSRFREDSELATVQRRHGVATPVSPLLADLIAAALRAASLTDGDVDPTIGAVIVELGYDRTFAELAGVWQEADVPVIAQTVPGWRAVRLADGLLTIPEGVRLDLGATAKAFAADLAAARVADELGVGVLVALGGDIATAGPDGQWRVLVQDPEQIVTIAHGTAVATSSTVSRTWRRRGRTLHHILDPSTGLPAAPVWRSVTICAARCVDANTLSTAAVIRGDRAPAWLRGLGVHARLVTAAGDVIPIGDWPSGRRS